MITMSIVIIFIIDCYIHVGIFSIISCCDFHNSNAQYDAKSYTEGVEVDIFLNVLFVNSVPVIVGSYVYSTHTQLQ